MKVILTDSTSDNSSQFDNLSNSGQCDCDCDCACFLGTDASSLLAAPLTYYLEITPVCNNRCAGCSNAYVFNSQKSKAALSGEVWIQQIKSIDPKPAYIRLTGGEVTLHPDFYEITYALQELEIPFSVLTNGRWRVPDELLAKLKRLEYFDGFLISLHGPDAETHQKFSGVAGSFDEAVRNISLAAEVGKQNQFSVTASFVIWDGNYQRIAETYQLAESLGVSSLICNRLISNKESQPPLSPENLKTAINTIEQLRLDGKKIKHGNCTPQCFTKSSSRRCLAGISFATIDPWGNVRPCNHAPQHAGNIFEQSVEEIWNSDTFREWREIQMPECKECLALEVCGGGCKAEALLNGRVHDVLSDFSVKAQIENMEPEYIYLYKHLIPTVEFTNNWVRGKRVISKKGTLISVPSEYYPLLNDLIEGKPLAFYQQKYGEKGLDWVGKLLFYGFVV